MPRSRRKTSVLDDFFDLLIEVPTWAGPIVVFGVFAAIRCRQGTDVGKISTPINAEDS